MQKGRIKYHVFTFLCFGFLTKFHFKHPFKNILKICCQSVKKGYVKKFVEEFLVNRFDFSEIATETNHMPFTNAPVLSKTVPVPRVVEGGDRGRGRLMRVNVIA